MIMFFKRPTHKNFDYIPRFYKPETDPEERRKRKFGFKRQLGIIRSKKNSFRLIALLLIVFYLYLWMSGVL
jgi:hypothetical protein